MVGIVLAALAMVPAVCFAMYIAFGVICTSGYNVAFAGAASIGAGFVVFVGFGVLIGILGTRITRAVPRPTDQNA
jgi:membrane protein implicated in regulation of membrane protease activity